LLTLRPDSADANAKLAYTLILDSEQEPALKAARRAIELGDISAEPHYAIAEASFRKGDFTKALEEADYALQSNLDFAPALITKSLALSSLKQPVEAAASLEQFLALRPDDLDADLWREQVALLRKSNSAASSSIGSNPNPPTDQEMTFSGKEVTVKARVLEKKEPTYTDAARKAGVAGTVVLKGIFSSSGEVKNLVVTRALGYGLTTRAVQAARGIKFTPASKDGHPVSMYLQLEYNFNLY
jgi:TonB family protein